VDGREVKLPSGVTVKLPDTDRLEVVEPGSVVSMTDELAASYVNRGMGVFCDGPEHLIRPGVDAPSSIERPGFDARPSRAEKAVAAPQRAGAV
jgi:hypothetical protein